MIPAETQTYTPPPAADPDPTRWLALLIRQGLLLIVAGIDARYFPDRARAWEVFQRGWHKS